MNPLYYYIQVALTAGLATTYGYGELKCGDIGHVRPCIKGEHTSSGDVFDPGLPTAAIAAPSGLHFRPFNLHLRVGDGPCISIRINDKMNPRYIGVIGFDLSPESVRRLVGKTSPHWVGRVTECKGK